MAVELEEFSDSLLREVNPPGSVAFAGLRTVELVGYLADAFWEARLDGFLEGLTCDPDGLVEPTEAGGADISRQEIALIIIYAGVRMLRNAILNKNTRFSAKAGSVEFETENSANVLTESLKALQATKTRLLDSLGSGSGTLVHVFDALSVRTYDALSYRGGIELT